RAVAPMVRVRFSRGVVADTNNLGGVVDAVCGALGASQSPDVRHGPVLPQERMVASARPNDLTSVVRAVRKTRTVARECSQIARSNVCGRGRYGHHGSREQ